MAVFSQRYGKRTAERNKHKKSEPTANERGTQPQRVRYIHMQMFPLTCVVKEHNTKSINFVDPRSRPTHPVAGSLVAFNELVVGARVKQYTETRPSRRQLMAARSAPQDRVKATRLSHGKLVSIFHFTSFCLEKRLVRGGKVV